MTAMYTRRSRKWCRLPVTHIILTTIIKQNYYTIISNALTEDKNDLLFICYVLSVASLRVRYELLHTINSYQTVARAVCLQSVCDSSFILVEMPC